MDTSSTKARFNSLTSGTRSQSDRDAARGRAQKHFTSPTARDAAVMDEIARENAARDAKTEKLKALRLAKEQDDAAKAAAEALANPPKVKKATRAKAKKAG